MIALDLLLFLQLAGVLFGFHLLGSKKALYVGTTISHALANGLYLPSPYGIIGPLF